MTGNSLKKIKNYRIYAFVVIGIVIGGVLALGVGSVSIPPSMVFKILFNRLPYLAGKISENWSISDEAIVLQFRFPRIILAFLVGSELSAAGVIYQGFLETPWLIPI